MGPRGPDPPAGLAAGRTRPSARPPSRSPAGRTPSPPAPASRSPRRGTGCTSTSQERYSAASSAVSSCSSTSTARGSSPDCGVLADRTAIRRAVDAVGAEVLDHERDVVAAGERAFATRPAGRRGPCARSGRRRTGSACPRPPAAARARSPSGSKRSRSTPLGIATTRSGSTPDVDVHTAHVLARDPQLVDVRLDLREPRSRARRRTPTAGSPRGVRRRAGAGRAATGGGPRRRRRAGAARRARRRRRGRPAAPGRGSRSVTRSLMIDRLVASPWSPCQRTRDRRRRRARRRRGSGARRRSRPRARRRNRRTRAAARSRPAVARAVRARSRGGRAGERDRRRRAPSNVSPSTPSRTASGRPPRRGTISGTLAAQALGGRERCAVPPHRGQRDRVDAGQQRRRSRSARTDPHSSTTPRRSSARSVRGEALGDLSEDLDPELGCAPLRGLDEQLRALVRIRRAEEGDGQLVAGAAGRALAPTCSQISLSCGIAWRTTSTSSAG